jgi:hypothetical protein
MKTRNLEIESYLFESEDGQIREIPFYELSIDEWVIYQNHLPKYLIDFNLRESAFNKQIKDLMEQGFELEEVIYKFGVYIGVDWTTKKIIKNKQVPNSQKLENIQLEIIECFSDVVNELFFIAVDHYNESDLINESTFFNHYLDEDENGFLTIQSFIIDRKENIEKLVKFMFLSNSHKIVIKETENVDLYDLTAQINNHIDFDILEDKYQEWLAISGRDNNMDEYGNMLDLIGYLKRNTNKKHLILRVERKNTVPNNKI